MLFDDIEDGEGFTFPWSGVIYIKNGPNGYRPEQPVNKENDDYTRKIASVNQSVEPV